ncbi:hypothetical protein HDV00_008084 [Rhizophlyctis rosea]|nr:hypothetical protein HDV00_008084 [Rhizophlyctis rosea]
MTFPGADRTSNDLFRNHSKTADATQQNPDNNPTSPIPYASDQRLTQDRPTDLVGSYGVLDVSFVLRKLHIGRRLRISSQHNLIPLFGDWEATNLTVTYTYRGNPGTAVCEVDNKGAGLKFLKTDLIVPPDLVDDDMEPTNQGKDIVLRALEGKSGMEIGGVSSIFDNVLPIYHVVKSLDNGNFAASTLWEKELKDGSQSFKWRENETGTQYIVDVTDLSKIRERKLQYDFVAAAHMLEHIGNPLRAIREIESILRPGGSVAKNVDFGPSELALMQKLVCHTLLGTCSSSCHTKRLVLTNIAITP